MNSMGSKSIIEYEAIFNEILFHLGYQHVYGT